MPLLIAIVVVLLLVLLMRSAQARRGRSFPPPTPAPLEKMKVIKKPETEPIAIRHMLPTAITPSKDKPILIKASTSVAIRPSGDDAIKIERALTVKVKPPRRGAWDERGWSKSSVGKKETYEGFYQVGKRRFQGRIEIGVWVNRISMYIHDPPSEIKKHEHRACFQLVKNGWFLLHWSTPAQSVDDAILYMEKILWESLHG